MSYCYMYMKATWHNLQINQLNPFCFEKLFNTHVCCISDLFCLFGLVLYIPVNSYGHVGTVSSPNQTFFLGKLD